MADVTHDVTDLENAYRVAFASTDGKNVNVHFGRADKFFIYLINDEEGYDFVEQRKVTPICLGGRHEHTKMEENTSLFTDCKYVAASRVGNGAAASLSAKKITAMELPGTVEEAILKIWKYNRVQGLFK
mgnify:CR=1